MSPVSLQAPNRSDVPSVPRFWRGSWWPPPCPQPPQCPQCHHTTVSPRVTVMGQIMVAPTSQLPQRPQTPSESPMSPHPQCPHGRPYWGRSWWPPPPSRFPQPGVPPVSPLSPPGGGAAGRARAAAGSGAGPATPSAASRAARPSQNLSPSSRARPAPPATVSGGTEQGHPLRTTTNQYGPV